MQAEHGGGEAWQSQRRVEGEAQAGVPCEQCDAGFINPLHAKCHVQQWHCGQGDNTVVVYQCDADDCEYETESYEAFRKHKWRNRHMGEGRAYALRHDSSVEDNGTRSAGNTTGTAAAGDSVHYGHEENGEPTGHVKEEPDTCYDWRAALSATEHRLQQQCARHGVPYEPPAIGEHGNDRVKRRRTLRRRCDVERGRRYRLTRSPAEAARVRARDAELKRRRARKAEAQRRYRRRDRRTVVAVHHCDVDGCQYVATSKEALMQHKRRSVHGIYRLKCVQCEYRAQYAKTLNKHQKEAHGIPTPIEQCYATVFGSAGAQSTAGNSLRDGPPQLYADSAYSQGNGRASHVLWCEMCDFACNKPSVMRRHHFEQHTDYVLAMQRRSEHTGLVSCNQCAYVSKEQSSLVEHIRTSHMPFTWQCDRENCTFYTRSKNAVPPHLLMHRSNDNVETT